MAPNAPRIEPLEGKRHERSIRLIVAGSPAYHRNIVNALVFLYLIDRDVSAESVEQACARLGKTLTFPVELDSIAIALTASIGAAFCPADSNSIATAAEERRERPGNRDANRRIEHRERVLRRGRVILGDGFSTIDCVIRDISAHGARFTVLDGIALPRTLSLQIIDTGRSHPAIRRWQRGPGIGVEFTTEAAEQQGGKAA